MKIRKLAFVFILLTGLLVSQESYQSVDQVKEEWEDYTTFQKQELVAFSNFLMSEGFYERALLGFFQFLYKYPQDSLEFAAYYQIAKSYEYMGNDDLAMNYYQRIIDEAPPESNAAEAADFQITYLTLKGGDYTGVLERTKGTDDPYDLVFQGYAYMQKLEWTAARQSFKAAEARFDHSHYTKLLRPLYKAINTAMNAPLKKRMPALLSALVPGGGHVYLKQYENALGSAFTSLLLYTAILTLPTVDQSGSLTYQSDRQRLIPVRGGYSINGNSNLFHGGYRIPDELSLKTKRGKLLVAPSMIAIGLYVGSIWKTVHDVDSANRRMVERYMGRVADKLSVERFMEYTEPEFVLK